MVRPGGTGKPSPAISARLAPLPPSSAFIDASPSARPPPKKYTYLVRVADPLRAPLVRRWAGWRTRPAPFLASDFLTTALRCTRARAARLLELFAPRTRLFIPQSVASARRAAARSASVP